MTAVGNAPAGLNSALFLVIAMGCAGAVHVLWMRLAPPGALQLPLDMSMTFRGRRLFGANKTLRGLVMMPLAGAASFAAFAASRNSLPDWLGAGMWPLVPGEYALIGMLAGLACMLAELPNSFVKRQLDIAPGELPRGGALRFAFIAADRIDTPLGMMIAVSSIVAVQPTTWIWVLLLGSGVHAALSALMHLIGIKVRAF